MDVHLPSPKLLLHLWGSSELSQKSLDAPNIRSPQDFVGKILSFNRNGYWTKTWFKNSDVFEYQFDGPWGTYPVNPTKDRPWIGDAHNTGDHQYVLPGTYGIEFKDQGGIPISTQYGIPVK